MGQPASSSASLAKDGSAHYPPLMAIAFARLAVQQENASKDVRSCNDSIKRMGEHQGAISNNQGAVAEEFFYTSLLERPQIGSFNFTKIVRNRLIGSKGKELACDLVSVNSTSVGVVEVKFATALGATATPRLPGQSLAGRSP